LFCKIPTSKKRKASYSVTLLEFLAELMIPTITFVCLFEPTPPNALYLLRILMEKFCFPKVQPPKREKQVTQSHF
jgi:hypothetical protein